MNLIDIRQVLTQILGFLLMVWILRRYAWGPLLGTLEARREKIAGDFKEADRLKAEAVELKGRYDAELRTIEAQARLREMEAGLGGGVDGGATGDPQRQALEEEIARYRGALPKLERERDFNQALVKFLSRLEGLAYGLREREEQGFSPEEKREIKQDFLGPTQAAYEVLIEAAESWRKECDPYASVTENATVSQVWERRNERLETRWQELRGKMIKPDDPTEMRLDDLALSLCTWLRTEYRILPEAWKNPRGDVQELRRRCDRAEPVVLRG